MWAGMVAHNNLVGVGRDQDWASHDIEHELSAVYDVAHGAGLATVFPAWMKYNVGHNTWRFAQAASRIWGVPNDFENPLNTALEGIERFKSFLTSIGMPVNFKELGANEKDIEAMAHKAAYGDGRTGHIGGFVSLSQEDIENIYKLAL
jgi:alcohol dehydrogenase YqhD (iron-dependent ADH family)